MSEKWVRQIRSEGSIQQLLCEKFIHPAYNDCVVVGNSSLKFYIMRSDNLKQVAKYDHNGNINAASIIYHNGKPEICFLADMRELFWAVPGLDGFTVTHALSLPNRYTHMSGGIDVVCLSDGEASVLLVDKATGSLNVNTLSENSKVISTAFIDDFLVIVERRGNIQISVFNREWRCVARHAPNYLVPYRIVPMANHKAAYVLGRGKVLSVKRSESGDWYFSMIDVNIKNTDDLIVDAAPMGVHLALLSVDGLVIKCSNGNCELLTHILQADGIASITLNRLVLSVEYCRLMLTDNMCGILHDIDDTLCNAVSYCKGSFITASKSTIHSVFYDYGIQTETAVTVKSATDPIVTSGQDVIFVSFLDRTVVLDNKFKDVTPGIMKKRGYERYHGNSHMFFIGVDENEVCVFDHGSMNTFPMKSTLSAWTHPYLYLAIENELSSYVYSRGILLRQNGTKFKCQITAMNVAENDLVVTLLDGTVYILDSEFIVDRNDQLGALIISIAGTHDHIAFGTATGSVLLYDRHLNPIRTHEVGASSVWLNAVDNKISVFCGKRHGFISGSGVILLPPDFMFFSGFGTENIFLAMVRETTTRFQLITCKFTDEVQGFHCKRICSCEGGRVTNITCGRHFGEFTASIVDNFDETTLYFSRGDVRYPLGEETIWAMKEWNAQISGKLLPFWIICTNGREGATLYIMQHSRSTNEVDVKIKKLFPDSRITGLTVVSSCLTYFVRNEVIYGMSLETGSLKQKGKGNPESKNVVALDSTKKYVVALYDNTHRGGHNPRKIFSVYRIAEDFNLAHCYDIENDSIMPSCIKIVRDTVVVSSRADPVVYLYSLETRELMRFVRLLSPVRGIFQVDSKALCCCIGGEIHALNCDGTDVNESDVSQMFSFGNFAFSVLD